MFGFKTRTQTLREKIVEVALPGDVVIVGCDGLISKGIRMFQTAKDNEKAECNHIAMYVGDGKIHEALIGGYVEQDIVKYLGKNSWFKIARLKSLNDRQRDLLLARSKRLVDRKTKYAVGDIFLQAVDSLFETNLFTRWFASRSKMLCSQAYAMCIMPWHSMFDGQTWVCVSPDNISDEVRDHPDVWEVIVEVKRGVIC